MPKVVKRDGSLEEFITEKISVSCLKAGAPTDVARRIAMEVEKKAYEKMTTAEIRETVLEMLRRENPEWAENWIVYDRAVKRRRPG
ncbi:MAG: ATP cone domain-containing protein [Candidatus Bathyarchaeia archaeon]